HVVGAERFAVAPGDARAQLDRQRLVVGAVLVALGEPGVLLVGKGAVEGERLVDQHRAALVVRADRVRVPDLVLGELALLHRAARDVGEGPIARNVGQRRGSCRGRLGGGGGRRRRAGGRGGGGRCASSG